jgi:ketopantoate reductase
MVINCVVNPLSAILRVRDREVAAPALRGIRRAIIGECASVADAEGVHLDDGLAAGIERQIRSYEELLLDVSDVMKGTVPRSAFSTKRSSSSAAGTASGRPSMRRWRG